MHRRLAKFVGLASFIAPKRVITKETKAPGKILDYLKNPSIARISNNVVESTDGLILVSRPK
jgi:hypothetical protein